MQKLLSYLLAFSLVFSGVAVAAPGVGNGPGTVQTFLCGSGALGGGQFCNEAGSSAPVNNCTIGAIVVLLGNGVMYTCTTTNTWTSLGSAACTGGTNINITSTCTINLTTPLTTSLIAGAGAPACATAGYICSSESTSAGRFSAGGSSSRGDISYGEHHSGQWSVQQPFTITDESTADMRFISASTQNNIYSETDAQTGTVPLLIAGNGGAAGSTITLKFNSTVHNGTVQAASAAAGTVTYVPPVYLAGGTAAASTMHCVQGTVTAAGISTTVTLTAPAAFANTNYWLQIEDFTTLANAVITTQATGSFTFTSVNTQVYNYLSCGA